MQQSTQSECKRIIISTARIGIGFSGYHAISVCECSIFSQLSCLSTRTSEVRTISDVLGRASLARLPYGMRLVSGSNPLVQVDYASRKSARQEGSRGNRVVNSTRNSCRWTLRLSVHWYHGMQTCRIKLCTGSSFPLSDRVLARFFLVRGSQTIPKLVAASFFRGGGAAI